MGRQTARKSVFTGLSQMRIQRVRHLLRARRVGGLCHTNVPPAEVVVNHGLGQHFDINQRGNALRFASSSAAVSCSSVLTR